MAVTIHGMLSNITGSSIYLTWLPILCNLSQSIPALPLGGEISLCAAKAAGPGTSSARLAACAGASPVLLPRRCLRAPEDELEEDELLRELWSRRLWRRRWWKQRRTKRRGVVSFRRAAQRDLIPHIVVTAIDARKIVEQILGQSRV